MRNAMNNRLKSGVQRLDPATVAFVAVPVLLYIPALYYSLTTPFSLVDDYVLWKYLHIFDGLHTLSDALGAKGYEVWGDVRYKPAWDFYIGATWKIFGPTPWLHHLARWAMNFGAVAAFAAALLCFQRRNGRNENGDSAPPNRIIRLLPLAALVYLWIFFPNQPAATLGPQEVQTVFFLAICVWMTALTLTRQGKPQSRRDALLIYAAFCVGFCGLAWSKETNLVAELWLLLSYYELPVIAALRRQPGPRISAVRALKSIGVWRALGGLPLIAVFLHTLIIVYLIAPVEGYGRAPLTLELLISNAAWLAETLFQLKTSLLIAAGLALLSAALLLFVAVNIAKKRFSDEIIFTLFLLGIFASLYLALCTSWTQALRYSYILIPAFTALLAFSTKFILDFAAERHQLKRDAAARRQIEVDSISSTAHPKSAARIYFARIFAHPPNLAACALTAFIAFFVCCNYYNFLYQTVVQHIARQNDASALAEITRLLDQGQYIQVSEARYVHAKELITYFHEFLPWFYGRNYDVHTQPPQEAGRPYHIVRHTKVENFRTVNRIPEAEQSYRPLAYAYRLADLLQTDGVYRIWNSGTNISVWQIYDSEFNRIWWNGEALDVRRLVADVGNPIIRSRFDIYLNDRWLIYINDRCGAAALDDTFFLAAFPVDDADLPKARKPHGFANLDFDFADYGFRGNERCLIVRQLPKYPIKRIHAGQFIITDDGFHHTWEGEAVLADE